jgi:hypothetical protein
MRICPWPIGASLRRHERSDFLEAHMLTFPSTHSHAMQSYIRARYMFMKLWLHAAHRPCTSCTALLFRVRHDIDVYNCTIRCVFS